MHRLVPVICGILFFSACGPKMQTPAVISHEMVTGYRFYTPCGASVLNARLPAVVPDAGDFYVYVLKDSLQIADCIDPGGIMINSGSSIRFGSDFLLTVVVKDARKEWYFSLEDLTLEDSLLQVKIVPHHVGDTAAGKPLHAVTDNYIWRISGRGVKLMKLYISPQEYAFVRGPKWSTAPLKWRLPRERAYD